MVYKALLLGGLLEAIFRGCPAKYTHPIQWNAGFERSNL
jgi:hypothetical protein